MSANQLTDDLAVEIISPRIRTTPKLDINAPKVSEHRLNEIRSPRANEPRSPKANEPRSPRAGAQKDFSKTKTKEKSEIQKQKKNVIDELIETEKYYLDHLELLFNNFMNPIKESQQLDKHTLYSLFANIESIHEINTKLYTELCNLQNQKLRKKEVLIGKIFFDLGDLLKLYAVYCSNQPFVQDRLQQLLNDDSNFCNFINNLLKQSQWQIADVYSYLITPLQRLCKYPLLIKELIKVSCKEGIDMLTKALEKVQTIVHQVNDRVKRAENLTKLISINQQIEISDKFNFTLLEEKREFLHQGSVLINGKHAIIFLFDDVALLCREKRREALLETFRIISLKLTMVSELGQSSEGSFELIELGNKPIMIDCTTKRNKSTWIKLFNTSISKFYEGFGEEREKILESLTSLEPKSTSETLQSIPKSIVSKLETHSHLYRFIQSKVASDTQSDLLNANSSAANAGYVKKLSNQQKDSRILALEIFSEKLLSKCDDMKKQVDQEVRLRINAEQKNIELQQQLDCLSKQLSELQSPSPSEPPSEAIELKKQSSTPEVITFYQDIVEKLTRENTYLTLKRSATQQLLTRPKEVVNDDNK